MLGLVAFVFLSGFSGVEKPVELAASSSSAYFQALENYDPEQAYVPAKKWSKIVRPEIAGWSSAGLARAKKFTSTLLTKAVVIVENGVVIDAWGDLSKRIKAHSIRKSFLSALYGTAVADGDIRLSETLLDLGINDKQGLTPRELKVPVSDLLKARSGIYHPANYETSSMRKKRPKRGSHLPGTFWYYNNWDFNALLTIFEKRTRKNFFQAFQRRIAKPIGMEHFRIKDTKYYRGKYSNHPAYLFRMSALDMARVGLLYLRNGKWGDRQVIPANWIKESTTAYSKTGQRGLYKGYGYLWWIGDDGYVAAGTGGQKIIVLPKYNLVVVHRVDTDVKGSRVRGKNIRKLLTMILEAQSPK